MDRCLESDESAIDAMKNAMNSLGNIVGKLNEIVETHDYDLVINQTVPPRPITQRAAAVKKDIDQVKVSRKLLAPTVNLNFFSRFWLRNWKIENLTSKNLKRH